MIKDCKDLGAEDIIRWRLDDLANAKKIKDSLVDVAAGGLDLAVRKYRII